MRNLPDNVHSNDSDAPWNYDDSQWTQWQYDGWDESECKKCHEIKPLDDNDVCERCFVSEPIEE